MSENKQPKDQLHKIMVEMFGMIEDMNTNEGQYLQFAEMFKQMNININRLAEMKTQLQQNYYYIHYVRPQTRITTLRRKRLTEAQKAKHTDYMLCNCGRYIHKDEYETHLQTQVHYQGRRNRKYASKKPSEVQMKIEINREVVLQEYIIKHLVKTKNIQIDNKDQDEQGI
jgi:hypothetical protein